jgi:60 kDa SS-A/Ro ribonucleoprotein
VDACLRADAARAIRLVVEISDQGRAPKNDPALFVLAYASGSKWPEATRKLALEALPAVARIPTHLFTFLEYRKEFAKWGRGIRKAVADWYGRKEPKDLAYHLVKYRQRGGWTHRDVLRLAHVAPASLDSNLALGWAAGKVAYDGEGRWKRLRKTGSKEKKDVKWERSGGAFELPESLRILEGFEKIQGAKPAEAVAIIREYGLPWEAVPTDLLKKAEVWEALLPDLPMTALLRNLGRMGANGLLAKGGDAARRVVGRLADEDRVRKARLHPLQALSALRVYAQGHGARGSLAWEPVQAVADALDELFYRCFRNVEPTGKRLLLAVDVSGSMDAGEIAGVAGLTPREAAATMAMVTARCEKDWTILGFSDRLVEVRVSPKMRLEKVCDAMRAIPMGGTDCALPMLWAAGTEEPVGRGGAKAREFDAFLVYTDSETWAGKIHPAQALASYRKASGIPAKLVVAAFTATEFSIADPKDGGMMDVVGFDSAAPQLLADFIRG